MVNLCGSTHDGNIIFIFDSYSQTQESFSFTYKKELKQVS